MKPEIATRWLVVTAWVMAALSVVLAGLAWGQDLSWQLGDLNAYLIFPLLGLAAYGLMWSQYMAGALRQRLGVGRQALAPYFRWSGYLVLILICLHPGLLVYQRFRDGAGLPPGSYESYVAPGLGWLTLLGTAGLLVFLALELRRWFGRKSWWPHLATVGDLAMVAVFYHGLRLGAQPQQGWFRYVWWFYGLTLLSVLASKYYLKAIKKPGS